jgi:hypothetical protein
MIELRDKDSGAAIGTITEEQLKFLVDQLEEESADDKDYYLNTTTLDMLATKEIDPDLLTVLRGALGDREEMEVEWSRP